MHETFISRLLQRRRLSLVYISCAINRARQIHTLRLTITIRVTILLCHVTLVTMYCICGRIKIVFLGIIETEKERKHYCLFFLLLHVLGVLEIINSVVFMPHVCHVFAFSVFTFNSHFLIHSVIKYKSASRCKIYTLTSKSKLMLHTSLFTFFFLSLKTNNNAVPLDYYPAHGPRNIGPKQANQLLNCTIGDRGGSEQRRQKHVHNLLTRRKRIFRAPC